jgi:hypothetical protein
MLDPDDPLAEQILATYQRIEAGLRISSLGPWSMGDDQTTTLFHYTDAAGFYGIVDTKQIHATHFRHLNDREELRGGELIIQEELDAQIAGTPVGRHRTLLRVLRDRLGPPALSNYARICVASFCEADDLLSQWRGYAAAGAGYSLGFSSIAPGAPHPGERYESILVKCVYGESQFRSLIAPVVNQLGNVLDWQAALPDEDGSLVLDVGLTMLCQRLEALVTKYKNNSFREEREWRLVAVPTTFFARDVLQFRVRRSQLIPYIPLDLGPAPLSLDRVIVGPVGDQDAAIHGAELFLAERGYSSTSIQRSQIPYRG